MNFLHLDFESFFIRKGMAARKGVQPFSLNMLTTQEYIESQRFEDYMCGFKWHGSRDPAFIVEKPQLRDYLLSIDWDNTAITAWNAMFDATILEHWYGIRPKLIVCPMSMARSLGIGKLAGGVSLAKVSDWFRQQGYDVPHKGHELMNVEGKYYNDMTRSELDAVGGYCATDVEILAVLFSLMIPRLSPEEIKYQDTIMRGMTEPMLRLDTATIQQELDDIEPRQERMLQRVADMVNTTPDKLKSELSSNDKFAGLLREHGYAVPTKISNTTGKETYAFAKSDREFKAMMESEDELLSAIVNARLGVKSTIAKTRARRFLDISLLPSGKFRMPLNISGAHTHRGSGADKINLQNLTTGRQEGQSALLRQSIQPLPGYVMAAPDSGQIEARVLAVAANHTELMDIFASGRCPYSTMGEEIYPEHDAAAIKSGDGAYKGAKKNNDAAGVKEWKPFYLMRQTGKAAVLQLGYQAGADSFLSSVRYTYGVTNLARDEAARIVKVYRSTNKPITAFWKTCENVIKHLCIGGEGYFGGAAGNMFWYGMLDQFGVPTPSIRLPDGMYLTYPMLRGITNPYETVPYKQTEYVYCTDVKKLLNFVSKFKNQHGHEPTELELWFKIVEVKATGERKLVPRAFTKRIYAGALTENVIQATAFAALKWQLNRMSSIVKFCFNVHDEHAIVLPVDGTEQYKMNTVQNIMSTPPPWLPGAKFDCEYALVDNYAAA